MPLDRELVEMARSPRWSDRARAGQALAENVGDPDADALLTDLLLDMADSAVIAKTANSLLERGDAPSWRVYFRAWNLADSSQADQLMGALSGALFSASLLPEKVAAVRNFVTRFAADSDENVRAGARQLLSRINAALPDY